MQIDISIKEATVLLAILTDVKNNPAAWKQEKEVANTLYDKTKEAIDTKLQR